MKAFVTDGDQRPALAVTRSLGRRGISVVVGEERSVSLASSSRFSSRHVTYPSPYRDREAFGRFVVELVERESIDVVIPVSDVTTRAIGERQQAIRRHSGVAVPPLEAFDFVSDKWWLLQRAAACGISIPRTQLVAGGADVQRILPAVTFPVVVKPARSRIRTDTGWLKASVHYADSESDLLRLYRETPYLACHPSLIQERITGCGTGIFVLFDRGRPLASFAHRRIREKPPSGGVSVLCESVAVEPELFDQADRLLGPLGWHGVAMVEYKRDRQTGQSVLMEVNGRFWGSLQLAVDAGVDFPYLTYQLALGAPLDRPPSYLVGARSRWLLGDVDHLLLRLFGRDRALHEPAPSRLRVLADFLCLNRRHQRDDVFRRDDPRPMMRELKDYLTNSLASAIGSQTRGVGARADATASGGASRAHPEAAVQPVHPGYQR